MYSSPDGLEVDVILDQGAGFGIVIGFGILFTVFTTIAVFLESLKASKAAVTSEWFNVAGRSVGTGLSASVIVSQWTWAATLLQSSTVAWKFGVSGPYWYASGATIQILLFGILAVEVKKKFPNTHSLCEIVRIRWGYSTHKVFLFFAMLSNIIVTGMLLLGGSAVLEALTGMSIESSAFLIPFGMVIYTLMGGLKATFLSSYWHTNIIMSLLLFFVFTVYGNPGGLVDASKIYDALQDQRRIENAPLGFLAGNKDGSYLTMASQGGLIFGVINIVGNFGTVFVDQSYWQSALAARPLSAGPAFIYGGLVWFAIPFSMATAMGLANLALGIKMSINQANSGLVAAFSAVALLGKSGAVLIITIVFMAVSSTGSAELIAISSLFTYDIYLAYVNPNASGNDLLRFSRLGVAYFAVVMGVLTIIMQIIGLSLGFVYLAMGVIIGSAVIPMCYAVLWDKCTGKAASAGAIGGLVIAVFLWLITARIEFGEVTLKSLGSDYPMLVGNLAAILAGGFIPWVMCFRNDYRYDWKTALDQMKLIDDVPPIFADPREHDSRLLEKSGKSVAYQSIILTLLMVVFVPGILYLTDAVFSKGFFVFWVTVAVAWALIGTFFIIFFPLWAGRKEIQEGLVLLVRLCQVWWKKLNTPARATSKKTTTTSQDQKQSSQQ